MAVKTFTTGEVLTASDTNTYLANAGLVYIAGPSFSASSAVSVDNCFSSTYANYRIVIEWAQNTTTGELRLKMRDSGGDISANYGFESAGMYHSSGVGTFAGFNNSANESQTSGYILSSTASNYGFASFDVYSPNLARETHWAGIVTAANASATLTRVTVTNHNRHTTATVCTGFSLIPSAGTVTGSVRIYGYRQA